MADLIASGPESMQRWRRPMPEGQAVLVGRAPRNGWAVPWDALISREHVELRLDGDKLNVRRLDAARNPVYYHDVDTSDFRVAAGEEFRIGKTSFQFVAVELAEDADSDAPAPFEERSFQPGQLNSFAFKNADERLEAVSKLPALISESATDEQLAARLVQLLLEAIPHADAAAVVQIADYIHANAELNMMRWDSRSETIGRFRPSRRLVLASLQRSEGILHVWQDADEGESAYTISGDLDWAFCIPINEEACRGWCLYVSGQFANNPILSPTVSVDDLNGDLRFVALLAEFIGSIRQVRMLESQQAGLTQFFSPAVVETLRGPDAADRLEPKESDITVLFCDVRGFSRKSEKAQHDLHELLNRVSDALGVMTSAIIKYDGVIADFQGDAALGFWGWPNEQPDGPLLACRAALDIQSVFQCAVPEEGSSLADFQVGIGIAHGRAIAGRIGTTEQIKVGAFGPVVNLGARLESMTKQLRVSILIDDATSQLVRLHLPASIGRCRRLGRVRPYGMEASVTVSELLPPTDAPAALTDQNIIDYETAVDAVAAGRWTEALERLSALPPHDRAKDFLTIFIAMNHYEPPSDWDGVVKMLYK